MANRQPRKSRQEVPGQFYGYSLQITRTVSHLLQARPGQSVAVECVGDVSTVSGIDGADVDIAEETKSGLESNPAGDRSVALWKTLHNWIEAGRRGAFTRETRFVLYVAQPHTGTIVERLEAIKSRPQARALVQDLRDEFWGKRPKFALKKSLPRSIVSHVNGVLGASDEILELLFINIEVERGSGSPNDDLVAQIRRKAISPSGAERVREALLGWTKTQIDKCIERRIAAVIPFEEFDRQLIAAARKFDRAATYLPSNAREPSPESMADELRSRTYVQQLQLIQANEDEQSRAVSDFLRAAADRTRWAEQGDVEESSFTEFEDQLRRMWANRRRVVHVQLKSHAPEEIGTALYGDCCSQTGLTLQGMALPTHFTPGSLHALADMPDIGWHPEYERLLLHPPALPRAVPGKALPALSPANPKGRNA